MSSPDAKSSSWIEGLRGGPASAIVVSVAIAIAIGIGKVDPIDDSG
jgi:hypothetical protein